MIFRFQKLIRGGTLVKSFSSQWGLQTLWHYQNYVFSQKNLFRKKNNTNSIKQSKNQQNSIRDSKSIINAIHNQNNQPELQPQINETIFLKKLFDAKDLLDLQKLKSEAFENNQICLVAYLYKLRKKLSQSNYKEYRKFIDDILFKLRSASTELLYDAEQLFEVISFHTHCIELNNEQNYQGVMFDHKICMLVSTFIHNNQYNFVQAVYLFHHLHKLQVASLELLINFVKMTKAKLSSKDKIDIQLLCIILNVYKLKNNHIFIETILYDVVIQYLLSNYQLVKACTFFQRFQLCCNIVPIDSKRLYRSDRRVLKQYLKQQLCFIIEKTNARWINQIFKDQKIIFYAQDSLNLKQIISLLHSLEISISYLSDAFEIKPQITAFCNKLWQIFIDRLNQIQSKKNWNADVVDAEHSSLLVRFIFQGLIYKIWHRDNLIKEKIYSLIIKLQFLKQQDLLPLYQKLPFDQLDSKEILQELFKISLRLCNTRIVPWSFMVICLNKMESVKSYKLINAIYLNGNFNNNGKSNDEIIPLIMVVNHFLKKYEIYISQDIVQSYTKLLQKLISQVQSNYRDEFQLAKLLRKAEFQLNDKDFYQEGIIFCIKKFRIFQRLNIHHSKSHQINNMVTNSDVLYLIYYLACANNPLISSEFTELLNVLEMQQKYTFNCFISFNIFTFQPIPYQINHSLLKKSKTYLINAPKVVANMKQVKFRHLTFQIFFNSYLNKSQKIKFQLFQLVKTTFISMFLREKSHKLALIFQLSEYIAEGMIVGTKKDLKKFLETVIQKFLSEPDQSVPYNCYLKVIVNGLACDLLSSGILARIYKHMVRSFPINSTSYATILYHTFVDPKDQQSFNQTFQNQNRMIKTVISKKKYRFANHEVFQSHSNTQNIFLIDTPIVATMLRNGIYLISFQSEVNQFISKIVMLKDFLLVCYSISLANINAEIDRLQKAMQTQKSMRLQALKSKICQTLLKKLQFYRLQHRLMPYQQQQIKQKLNLT